MAKYYHEGNTFECQYCGTATKELVKMAWMGDQIEVCEDCKEEAESE